MLAAGVRLALDVLDKGTSHAHFHKLSVMWTGHALGDLLPLIPDPEKATSFETKSDMLIDVFFFNTQGTDTARGQFGLDDDERLTLNFPKNALANDPVFQKAEEIMKAMAQAMGGEFKTSFLWDGFTKKRIITVQPLGGCPMGNSSSDGVVDKDGQVFKTNSGGSDVHVGLHVNAVTSHTGSHRCHE